MNADKSYFLRTLSVLICVLLWFHKSVFGQTLPAELPRDQIVALYRGELGDRFDEKQFDAVLAAHRKIEAFFVERNSKQRAAIVGELVDSKIDPVILGRICRIRLHWPDLAGGVYYVNERIGPHNVAYFLGLPKDYVRTKAWPMVVRLPRADAFATKPPPDQQQVASIYTEWITADLAAHPDAIVLMPLLNFDNLF